jgi:DNA-binding transcriptional LysR family regulator
MLEGVTIEQLRTVRAVAREGSFSAAARKLGRVQAAVSQAIDRLEAQLGLRLFDRTSRMPRLTPHGEVVVAAAERILHEVEALGEAVGGLKRGAETRLAIAVDSMVPATVLVDFARALAREHPSVQLVLMTETLSTVTAHVRARRAAWGIAGQDADLTDLEHRHIADLRLLPVVAAGHPLARPGAPLDLEALASAVQIVLSVRRDPSEPVAADHGVLSPQTWRVADLATKHALIRGGLGWGHLPEHLVKSDLARRRLVALELAAWGGEPPRYGLSLVRRRGARVGPIAQWAEVRLLGLCHEATAAAAAPASTAAPAATRLKARGRSARR